MALRLPTASRNSAADAVVDRIDVGAGTAKLQIRSGGQPASANDAATGTLLAEFDLPNPCFGAAATGTATANAITNTTGLADGTAGWYRVLDRGGGTVCDGAVGAEMTLNTTTISTGGTVSVTSWTHTQPAG